MDDILSQVNKIFSFDNHKFVTFLGDNEVGLRGFIAIHRGNGKIPAFGATRIWNYSSTLDALNDSVRLAKIMSYKAALAGIKCGGAKAALISNGSTSNRKRYLRSYADKVNYLSGRFITGADVGVSREDVKLMRRISPYFVGGISDPVRFTSYGIFLAIKECLREIYGSETLENRSFAIQGVGKIGSELIKNIYPYTKKIVVADINPLVVKTIKKRYPDIKVVSTNNIIKQKVDVFSPCALSNCLNKETISRLKCKIIAGGANNQLESETIGFNIHKKGILYAPDYVVNAGGLISVYDEFLNKNSRVRRVAKRVRRIRSSLKRILEKSKRQNKPTFQVADQMAKKKLKNLFN